MVHNRKFHRWHFYRTNRKWENKRQVRLLYYTGIIVYYTVIRFRLVVRNSWKFAYSIMQGRETQWWWPFFHILKNWASFVTSQSPNFENLVQINLISWKSQNFLKICIQHKSRTRNTMVIKVFSYFENLRQFCDVTIPKFWKFGLSILNFVK